MEIVKVIAHIIGIPTTIYTILNINLNTWQGWVTFILSSLYILALIIVFSVKSWQAIRKENFEHKLRKQKG